MGIDVHAVSREELERLCLAQQAELRIVKAQNQWLKRQVFGQKSERLIAQDPRQATLFDVPVEPPPEAVTVKSYERSARREATDTDGESGIRFDPSVPVDEEVVLPNEVKSLSCDAYEVIGEKVTERLVQIPAQYRVKRTVRKTVKLKETQTLHTAPAPAAVIERSFADATLLAGLVTDKFQ